MSGSLIAVRGKDSFPLQVKEWNATQETSNRIYTQPRACRIMKFSNTGNLFAFCNGEKVIVLDTKELRKIWDAALPKTCALFFSPDDKILCCFEPFFTTKDNPTGNKNLSMYDISTGDCLLSYVHKKQSFWHPVWTSDSQLFGRLFSNSVFFYAKKNLEEPVSKLHIEKLENFSISPTKSAPCNVACFVRGTKGAPSMVRIFKYPDFAKEQVVASKSFFKADQVVFYWCSKGNAVLVKAMTEVDTTGESYYGEQSLHYMNTNGDTSIVQLPKKGPIYDVAWDPDSTKFCVIYGYMPAKASLFNHKCDVVHNFGPSPKNMCVYNPHGNMLLLGGFGNLRGNIEIWHNDPKNPRMLSQFEAPDTNDIEWCADGEHFLTSTTSPRLRVNNGYKIWHYTTPHPVVNVKFESELHEVRWQLFPSGRFPPPDIVSTGMSDKKPVAAAKPASYVPPHARGRSDYNASKFKQDEDEEEPETNLSKSALKNKKKRDAKKKKETETIPDRSQSQQDAVAMAKYLLGNNPQTKNQPTTNDNEKKLKNLRKKLQNIEKLKTQQREGKQLEKNQLEKILTETALLAEIEQLTL